MTLGFSLCWFHTGFFHNFQRILDRLSFVVQLHFSVPAFSQLNGNNICLTDRISAQETCREEAESRVNLIAVFGQL